MGETRTYSGGCHCGAVRYQVTTDLEQVMDCNCSHCAVKGFVLTFVPAGRFQLTQGEGELTEYRFNRKQIQHLFCKRCGVESFARGQMPDGSPTVMVNVRCLEGVDVGGLALQHFNGKDF